MRSRAFTQNWSGRDFFILLSLAVAYFVTARFGLALQPVSGFATLIWPPSGIALAILFMFGKKYWPGVFVGAFAANVVQGAPLFAALGIASGNTLAALTAVHLLQSSDFSRRFTSLKSALSFIFLAALFSPLISSTIGTLSLAAEGVITYENFLRTWGAWWVGDSFGIISFSPLIFAWLHQRIDIHVKRVFTLVAVLAAQVAITLFIITNSFENILFSHPSMFIFPLMLVAALTFGLREVTLINAVTALAAAFGVIYYRSSASSSILEQLLPFQGLIIFLVCTALLINTLMRRQRSVSVRLEVINSRLKEELQRRKELERMKDDFVSLASHQLRTPLTATKWLIETLHNKKFGDLTEKQESYTERIYQINERMISLVSETLKAFRLESIASGTRAEKVSAGEVMDSALLLVRDVAQKNNIAVINKVNGSTQMISTDKELLKTALECFLSNAVSYSKSHQQIVADVEEKAGQIIFSVSDSGIGIPESERQSLFDRFHRASNAIKYKPDGTGLGLYMASRIAKHIGGNIWFDSKEGKGSTFYISVPKAL